MRPKLKKNWSVYIVRCADKTFYCGSTNDIKKRIEAHNAGKGARYTRGRGPVTLVYKKCFKSKSAAMKEEFRVKQLTRDEKKQFIKLLPRTEPHRYRRLSNDRE